MLPKALSVLSILALSVSLSAQTVLVDRSGVAVKGYDVVAYFTQRKPVMGNAKINAEHEGVTYHFSSEEHKRLFVQSPKHYLPAYGGYCAYAVSKGSTARIQPQLWVIHNDRLFLNFNNGTQRAFASDLDKMIALADKNWVRIRERLNS